MNKPHILAIYGSPRKDGNTDIVLREAVRGAKTSGCLVNEVYLRDLTLSPCLEIYGCKKTGRCVIEDDFQQLYDQIEAADAIMLASPIFFYAVSAHTKILMDRCQSFWVKKYWLEGAARGEKQLSRLGFFVSVAATQGKKLFDGPLLSVRYFFEAIDTALWGSLLYRGIDHKGEILDHQDMLATAFDKGKEFGSAVKDKANREAYQGE